VRFTLPTVTAARTRRIDEIGDESRRRIMDAAEELFRREGLRENIVRRHRRAVGDSRGSIPWHFQNKDGLLTAVVERAIDRYIPADSLTSFDVEGLRSVIERVKQWLRHPTSAMIFTVLAEALTTDGPVHDHYVAFFRDRRKGIAQLLAATTSGPSFSKADLAAVEPATAVLHGALVGLGLQYQLDPTLDLDAAFDALTAMVETLTAVPATTPPRRRRR